MRRDEYLSDPEANRHSSYRARQNAEDLHVEAGEGHESNGTQQVMSDLSQEAANWAYWGATGLTRDDARTGPAYGERWIGRHETGGGVSFRDERALADAETAINARAVTFGYSPTDRDDDVQKIAEGYAGRYPNHDLYALADGRTFEVHGDIRAKYNALGGALGRLGFPQTDESITPDTVGRYNHFANGSIYWTPHTGPFAVLGTVRDRWAATGWEQGPFGYPVQDQHHMRRVNPAAPAIEWCRFEHGVIAGDQHVGKDAPVAVLTYQQLGDAVGRILNAQFVASPDNVAMMPGVALTGVTDWSYDFWSSKPRSVSFEYRGFRDNGLAPDTDFAIGLSLTFQLVWTYGLTEPATKSLAAGLEFLRVRHVGVDDEIINISGGIAEIITKVRSAIRAEFFPAQWPNPEHPEIPVGARHVADVPTGFDDARGTIDVLDVIVAANGDLLLAVNPFGPPDEPANSTINWGYLRQMEAQRVMNLLTE